MALESSLKKYSLTATAAVAGATTTTNAQVILIDDFAPITFGVGASDEWLLIDDVFAGSAPGNITVENSPGTGAISIAQADELIQIDGTADWRAGTGSLNQIGAGKTVTSSSSVLPAGGGFSFQQSVIISVNSTLTSTQIGLIPAFPAGATAAFGFRFQDGADTHYGWLELTNLTEDTATLSRYAYETTPNVGIHYTGVGVVPEPATGLLALVGGGAAAFRRRRRKAAYTKPPDRHRNGRMIGP